MNLFSSQSVKTFLQNEDFLLKAKRGSKIGNNLEVINIFSETTIIQNKELLILFAFRIEEIIIDTKQLTIQFYKDRLI